MMIKDDREGLIKSELFRKYQEIFEQYINEVIMFSQEFDPTDHLMVMAQDPDKFETILSVPDQPVPLDFVLNQFWPRLGLLPMEPDNPDLILKIAEFMLNELILKYSPSLEKLNLNHMKELFTADGDEYEEEQMQQEMAAQEEQQRHLQRQKDQRQPEADQYDEDLEEEAA